jgi:hypothetical protein
MANLSVAGRSPPPSPSNRSRSHVLSIFHPPPRQPTSLQLLARIAQNVGRFQLCGGPCKSFGQCDDLNGVPWQADQTSEEGSNKFTLQLSGHHKASQNKIVIFFNRAKAVAGTVIPIKFKMGEVAEAGVTLAAVDAEGMPTGESKSASTATITISEVSDTRITGTFEGTNTGLTITDGKFDMDFTRVW